MIIIFITLIIIVIIILAFDAIFKSVKKFLICY